MEPVSLAASLIALTSATTNAVKFFSTLHNAPSELQRLHQHVRQLRSALDLELQFNAGQLNADAPGGSPYLGLEKTKDFESALSNARSCLELIESSLAIYHGKPGKITHTLEQLKEMRGSNGTQMNFTYSQLIPPWLIDPPQNDPSQILEVQKQRSLLNVYRTRTCCKTIQKRSSNTYYMVFQKRSDELRTVYRISVTFRLPSILSAHALSIQAEATFSVLCWPSFSQYVSLKNIVPDDSDFMKACSAGDYESARNIALDGKGSPTDIDEHGQPALHRAVRSGSHALVKILVENGASANEPERVMYESPLQVACKLGLIEIGRLLMFKGACIDHVDLGGFTAVVSLWYKRTLSFSRADFLKAMLAYSPLPIRSNNDEFWNPAFQVATQGCASDMELLLHLGANIYDSDMSGNNIMKYCIMGSNVETFDYLVDHMPAEWIHKRDHQGRTALHHVFNIPNPFAVALAGRLIEYGADIHAKDDQGLSVGDIAGDTDHIFKGHRVWKTGACQNFDAWLKTLQSLGHDVEVDSEGDLIWPAVQGA